MKIDLVVIERSLHHKLGREWQVLDHTEYDTFSVLLLTRCFEVGNYEVGTGMQL